MEKIQRIPTGIFGVNTWIIRLFKNTVMIVDPDCSEYTGDDKAFIQFLKDNKLIPVFTVLTHGHFDHVAGIRPIKNAFPYTKILIHKADEKMIGPSAIYEQDDFNDEPSIYEFVKASLSGLPKTDGYLEDGKKLSELPAFEELRTNNDFLSALEAEDSADYRTLSGLENVLSLWKILLTPGHTEGSCCLYNETEKMLVSGDTVFYHSYGRTDLKDGSDAKMARSLTFLQKTIKPETLVYPGHDYSGFVFGDNWY